MKSARRIYCRAILDRWSACTNTGARYFGHRSFGGVGSIAVAFSVSVLQSIAVSDKQDSHTCTQFGSRENCTTTHSLSHSARLRQRWGGAIIIGVKYLNALLQATHCRYFACGLASSADLRPALSSPTLLAG